MNFTIFMDQLKDLRSTKYKYLLGAFVIFALVCVFGVLDAIWLIIRGKTAFRFCRFPCQSGIVPAGLSVRR